MATKTYRAIGSIVNIIELINGHNVPINFIPVSGYEAGRAGSRYTTSDELIQQAMESRFDFGTLFYLENDEKREYDENGVVLREFEEVAAEQETTKLETVKVDSIQTAKTYLVEHYGWQPASRISKAKVIDAAEQYGIVFDGLN